MVKKRKPGRKPKEVHIAPNYIESSDFVDPYIDRNRDQILDACKLKTFRVNLSQEDNTNLPERYMYIYSIDFHYKTKDLTEDPLPPDVVEEYFKYADELLEDFINKAPDYNFSQEVLDYQLAKSVTIGELLEAIRLSPYNLQFKQYLENMQFSSINSIQAKSKDEELILETIDHIKRGLPLREIAKEMTGKVSYQRISNINEQLQIFGDKYVSKVRKKLAPAIKPEHMQFLKEISEDPRNTVLSGRERKLLLCNHFGIKIKTDHVRDALKQLGYSKKRVRNHVPEADRVSHKNARCRVAQQLIMLQRAGKEMISLDEAQVNRGETAHYGWAKRGQKALNINGRKGVPLQIVTAVRSSGLLGYTLRKTKVDQYAYKHFLGLVIDKLREIDPNNYKDRFFLFMDNASAHKTKMIKDYIEMQGIIVLCNSPMTPQLNPIEYIFSMFKWNLRRRPMSNHDDLVEWIYEAFKKIRHRHIYNAYIHAMRSYKPSLKYELMHDARGYSKVDAHIKFSGNKIKSLINFVKLNT